MSIRLAGKYKLLLALLLVLVLADQVTKYLAVEHLTGAFEHYGRRTLVERVGGLYTLSNLDNYPAEQGKRDLRRAAYTVVPGFWSHRYVENPGAAWGILAGVSPRYRLPFFHLMTALALLCILVFYRRLQSDQKLLSLSLALVFAGAFGNYVDRLARGYVIDFVDWYWRNRPDLHWPTFNVADAAITVGVVLMLLDSLIHRHREPAPSLPPTQEPK
jgi:signal peptidase II